MPERHRWVAVPPFRVGRPPPPRPAPYRGPPRYREVPRWGFPPSVWIPTGSAPPAPAPPRSPLNELRTAAFLIRAVAGFCLIAAGAEVWRYVLLVRGRTHLLSAAEVRANDLLTTAAGRVAVLFAGITVVVGVLPALGRTAAFAAHRAGLQEPRTGTARLAHLLTPVWNLYGAGLVLAEIDALVGSPAPPAPRPPAQRFRWLSGDVAELGKPVAPVPSPTRTVRVHRQVQRRVWWWWAAWLVNGALAAGVLIRVLVPGDLQVQADLVLLFALVDLSGGVVAVLTVGVLDSWRLTLAADHRTGVPPGWVVRSPAAAARLADGADAR